MARVKPESLVIVGMAPRVVAMDAETGELRWATELPNSYEVVSVHREGSVVYAGSCGEVSCLDAATGKVLWHNPLKGMGTSYVVFATSAAVPAAAQAASDAAASSTYSG